MSVPSLKSVKVRCPRCDATHYRPRRVSSEEPPETIRATCLGPHPNRGADFEGCGETVRLVVEEVSEID